MSKKHHGGPAPVPPSNRPVGGKGYGPVKEDGITEPSDDAGVGFQEQDPKRRLGNYQTEGEHSIQQPGPLNDG